MPWPCPFKKTPQGRNAAGNGRFLGEKFPPAEWRELRQIRGAFAANRAQPKQTSVSFNLH